MSSLNKFLTYEGLIHYDEKLKEYVGIKPGVSPYSIQQLTQEGAENIAGCKGYYWYSIDFNTKEIKLTTEQNTEVAEFDIDWQVGDILNISNNTHYVRCSNITAINKNIITVDKLPFNSIVTPDSIDASDYGIINTDNPLSGVVSFGSGAFAEGSGTIAMGQSSHAEGKLTKATGFRSHAEGYRCEASGDDSHAEGLDTVASGWASHASGRGTKARETAQTVIGMYNSDNSNALFIIGNGTLDTARKNAFEVTANSIKIGNTELTEEMLKKVIQFMNSITEYETKEVSE